MSKATELPIHEVIVKIMFNADREKPMGLSASDVLWKIDNPEVSERHIREVLDWLVREKRVKLYLDKYSLDRYEFLDQKAKHEEETDDADEGLEPNTTFYINPPRKKTRGLRNKIILCSGILALLYMTYLFNKMNRSYVHSSKEITTSSTLSPDIPVKNLYLSEVEDEKNWEQKFNDVAYSFSRQNSNNKNVSEAIHNMSKTIDSLQKQHIFKLNKLQKQIDVNMNNNISYTNALLQKIMICNFIFLAIIVLTFFKGKLS
ncbi:DUF5457 domain-containing protein [Tamlana sp. I1]|uniref:DUF5457 domain-containing protein n=1 Tax=Tamlana sp. I1 TaxID=2762061 RepID=UPI00188E460F|nr:DUF5457 domain-containing protein [Tamlana sp. I1]